MKTFFTRSLAVGLLGLCALPALAHNRDRDLLVPMPRIGVVLSAPVAVLPQHPRFSAAPRYCPPRGTWARQPGRGYRYPGNRAGRRDAYQDGYQDGWRDRRDREHAREHDHHDDDRRRGR